jgi:hypothetical protein
LWLPHTAPEVVLVLESLVVMAVTLDQPGRFLRVKTFMPKLVRVDPMQLLARMAAAVIRMVLLAAAVDSPLCICPAAAGLLEAAAVDRLTVAIPMVMAAMLDTMAAEAAVLMGIAVGVTAAVIMVPVARVVILTTVAMVAMDQVGKVALREPAITVRVLVAVVTAVAVAARVIIQLIHSALLAAVADHAIQMADQMYQKAREVLHAANQTLAAVQTVMSH